MTSSLMKLLNLSRGKCGLLKRMNSTLTCLDVNSKSNIAILTLANPPANTLGLDMLKSIETRINELENLSKRPKGLIITSNLRSIFCAGLNLKELHTCNETHLTDLWKTLQTVCMKLYTSEYPTVAAINGHAIAGGCALSVACDHRIMVLNYKIGLNETKVGLHVPKWLIAHTKNVLPRRIAEGAILEGRIFNTVEAFRYGLIDEVARDSNEAIEKAEKFLDTFNNCSLEARNLTKQSFRNDDVQSFKKTSQQDLETFLYFIKDSKFQENLGKYLEKLSQK